MSVITNYRVRILATEEATMDLGTKDYPHLLEDSQVFLSGTDATTKADGVYSDAGTNSTTIGLTGSLYYLLGDAQLDFVDIAGFAIENTSTATGKWLTLGGGAAAWAPMFADTSDKVKIPPGGLYLWTAGLVDDAGVGVTFNLAITCAAADVAWRYIVWGRTA